MTTGHHDGLFGPEEMESALSPPGQPVLAFDPSRRNNAERIVDLVTLGYIQPPVLDVTYGLGKFWSIHRPSTLYGADLNPDKAPHVIADFTRLPFRDNAFRTVVFDPPYRMGGGADPSWGGVMDDRYGVATEYTAVESKALLTGGTIEAIRLVCPGGMLIAKCQDAVNRGKVVFQTSWIESAAAPWADVIDVIHFTARTQPMVKSRIQRRARRNYSTFVILKKRRTSP